MRIYIYTVHPMLINNELVWDVYYVTGDSRERHCLRIYNVEVSFMVARLPGYTMDMFNRYIRSKVPDTVRLTVRTGLQDSEYYAFDHKREYMEIHARSPSVLRRVCNDLEKSVREVYGRISTYISTLDPHDRMFYLNTETPFRYTEHSTSLTKSMYVLSTKYNVPLIGGAILDEQYIDSVFPDAILPDVSTRGLNINNIHALVRDDSIDFKRNLVLMSYDIETYTIRNMNPVLRENYIMCIGAGFFTLDSQIPYRSVCIITKDIASTPADTSASTPADTSTSTQADTSASTPTSTPADTPTIPAATRIYNRKRYKIPGINADDVGEYIIARNEKDLLELFIKVIAYEKPQIVTGFNTYEFDDNFVYKRMEMHGIQDKYLQLFTPYNFSDTAALNWYKYLRPEFNERIELKMDGDMGRDNKTIRSYTTVFTDVRKLMLKEDPKRFTQYGRGTLDAMLETYKVLCPYTHVQLAKTDMDIQEMFRLWAANTDIYRIALYCRQDAWITGTLLIRRSKLSDLIELANMSYTMLQDSVFRADGLRVNNSIIAYGISNNYAVKDTRPKTTLGGKTYDTHTIVGGAVENIHPGKHLYVTSLDFTSMYPSNKEANMIDSSSRVDEDYLRNPEQYGLTITHHEVVDDPLGMQRDIYTLSAMPQTAPTPLETSP